MEPPSSPLGAAALARAADEAAAAAAGGGEDAAVARGPFKRLASRTLSDRWMQEQQASPDELVRAARAAAAPVTRNLHARLLTSLPPLRSRRRCAAQAARENKSVHVDGGGEEGGERDAAAGGDGGGGDPMTDAPLLRLHVTPGSHAERSGASLCAAERGGTQTCEPRRAPRYT